MTQLTLDDLPKQARTPFEMFQGERVTDVRTIEEFLDRYYRPDRYKSSHMLKDYPDYPARLLASHKADLAKYGVDWISRHDSVTGKVVAFYTPAS